MNRIYSVFTSRNLFYVQCFYNFEGQRNTPSLSGLIHWADILTAGAWTLTLLCKDLNRVYWQEQAVHDWLQNSLILQDVLIVASLVVGASLPWLGRVTSVEACPKPSPRSDSKKDA